MSPFGTVISEVGTKERHHPLGRMRISRLFQQIRKPWGAFSSASAAVTGKGRCNRLELDELLPGLGGKNPPSGSIDREPANRASSHRATIGRSCRAVTGPARRFCSLVSLGFLRRRSTPCLPKAKELEQKGLRFCYEPLTVDARPRTVSAAQTSNSGTSDRRIRIGLRSWVALQLTEASCPTQH